MKGHRPFAASPQRLAVCIFAALMFAITLWWGMAYPVPGDAGDNHQFLAGLMRLADAIPGRLFTEPAEVLNETSHGGRPILYQALAAPLTLAFGRSEGAAVAVNGFLYLLLILSVFRIGSMVKDETTGFLSAFVAATYPQVVQLSHTFLPVFALTAFGALGTWALLSMWRSRTVKSAWLFGGALASGLLVHPQFLWLAIPLASVAPLCAFFRQATNSEKTQERWKADFRFIFSGLVPAGIAFSGLVSAWFLTIGISQFHAYQRISNSAFRESKLIAHMFKDVEASRLWYLETAPMVLTNVLTIFLLIGIGATFLSRNVERWILLWVSTIFVILMSLQTTLDWIYMVQVLPIVAVISTAWIVDMKPRALAGVLTLICLGTGAVSLMVGTVGVTESTRPIAKLIDVCQGKGYSRLCPRPLSANERAARKRTSPEKEILDAILAAPDCGDRTCRVMYLKLGRAPRFQYYLARYWPRSDLLFSSVGSHMWGSPFNFSGLLSSDYVVYPTTQTRKPSHPPSPYTYHIAAVDFLTDPPEQFAEAHERVSTFQLGKVGVEIIRRKKPLTSNEARASLQAVALDEKYKTQGYAVLIDVLRKEKQFTEAAEVCDYAEAESGIEIRFCRFVRKKAEKIRQRLGDNSTEG